MSLAARFRLAVLNLTMPIVRVVGRLHAPFSHRRVTGVHYHHAASRLIPGQVLVCRKQGELTNLLIPGDYTHAAVYCGPRVMLVDGQKTEVRVVVEAVSPRVRVTDLATFLTAKDRVLALSPTFCGAAGMLKAADAALANLGIEYDYLFEPNDGPRRRAFYCAELAWDAYRVAFGDMPLPFVLRETLGVPTVTPQDFVDAERHWRVDWDSADIDGMKELEVA